MDEAQDETRRLTRSFLNPPPVPERAARAHALKNCISVVRAVAYLVKPELSPTASARFERLDSAIGRMEEILHHDLAAAIPQTTAEPFDVRSFVQDVSRRLYDRAEGRGVVLLVHCDEGEAYGRKRALEEALFNLIANAIDASPPGGAVLVDTCTTPAGDQLWRVQDTGAGLDIDAMRHIGRVGHSATPGGSGVGVALAANLVQREEGILRFESTPNRGTTVMIWLPGRSQSAEAETFSNSEGAVAQIERDRFHLPSATMRSSDDEAHEHFSGSSGSCGSRGERP